MQPAGGFGDIGDTGWSYSGGTVGLNYEHTFRRTGHTLTVSARRPTIRSGTI